MIIYATYVSVWDDEDQIRTSCKWDTEKRVAFDIEIGDEPEDVHALTREFVELPNGTEIDVDHEQETDDGIPAISEEDEDE